MSQREISRRSVVRGAMWSVPVVAAAAAVPMAAASGDGPVLMLRSGCVAAVGGGYLGAGVELQNVGSTSFIGHINYQEFLDIGLALDVGNIPYAFSLRKHQFEEGSSSPLGWSFPGNRRRGNRSTNFRGELWPGQRIAVGQRFAWTRESSVSMQPEGWLAHIEHSAIIRSITPDDGVPVRGIAVGSTSAFVWGDALISCAA